MTRTMRSRLSAVALIYLFRINWQLLVVSLEVAAAVGSQQKGDQLSLAGVGSRSPRNRGISRAPFWVRPSPFARQPRVRFLYQGELTCSCLLSYLTLSREVDGMLGPGDPKDGEGVSTVKGHLSLRTFPFPQKSPQIFPWCPFGLPN